MFAFLPWTACIPVYVFKVLAMSFIFIIHLNLKFGQHWFHREKFSYINTKIYWSYFWFRYNKLQTCKHQMFLYLILFFWSCTQLPTYIYKADSKRNAKSGFFGTVWEISQLTNSKRHTSEFNYKSLHAFGVVFGCPIMNWLQDFSL